jgi:hypothetical protein
VAKEWGPDAQKAFEGVKHALTHAPVLVLPDFQAAQKDTPFEVVTDASLTGIGAVLLQGGRPIAFESKKFSPAERNYNTWQRELLGMIALKVWRCYLDHALKVWRCYLEELPFVLVTDHHSNTAFDGGARTPALQVHGPAEVAAQAAALEQYARFLRAQSRGGAGESFAAQAASRAAS